MNARFDNATRQQARAFSGTPRAERRSVTGLAASKHLTAALPALVLVLFVATAAAQNPPPQPDPLSALLMSQPVIDTTSPVTATASFDPPIIRPGGVSTYRVTFNAMMDSIQWPEEIIAPQQLELQLSARGQIFTFTGTNQQPRTSFNCRTRATTAGTFTVPRFIVYAYGKPVTVPAATLMVTADPAIPIPTATRLQLEISSTNPFAGQAINVRVLLPGTPEGVVQGISLIKLNGDGFMTDQMSVRQRVESLNNATGSRPFFIYEISATPIQAGPQELSAQGFTSGNQFGGMIIISGRATIPGGPPQYILLDSDPVKLNVRPLPRENELPGFHGAIGHFTLDKPVLSTNALRVGDPVTLTVNVRGDGNLARLVPPPPPKPPGWQVFAGPVDNAPPQLVQTRGFITFSYTLIPTREEARTTPVIPFSYFDPDQAAFVDLSVPSASVTVKPGAAPVDIEALAQLEAAAPEREKEPVLSGMATAPGRTMASLVPLQQRGWFPLVQLAPALVFAALWFWDRRQRYFEQHPEILLRRRARRALHREWAAVRKAASLGDTPRFAACAVNAMRVACAPHYPAEPRALVSSDVLPLLAEPQTTDNGAETVRRIFAAANADRFATQPAAARDLLALRPDLDRVLTQLEDKLR